MTLPSNSSLSAVLDSARENALQSFAFFATHALGIPLREEVCTMVQLSIEARQPLDLDVPYSRILATAIIQWLAMRQMNVFFGGDFVPARHEVLEWLDITNTTPSTDPADTAYLITEKTKVSLTWL